MSILARLFAVTLLQVLAACAAGPDDDTYAPAPDLVPSSAALLVVGHLDTGFLFFGHTSIAVIMVDGKRTGPEQLTRLLLAPGAHTVFVRAFRDPVAAYACIPATFEAGKTYVAQTTKPYLEGTTIWIEDQATGKAVSDKISAKIIRDPIMWGPALKALFVDAPPGCPVETR